MEFQFTDLQLLKIYIFQYFKHVWNSVFTYGNFRTSERGQRAAHLGCQGLLNELASRVLAVAEADVNGITWPESNASFQ